MLFGFECKAYWGEVGALLEALTLIPTIQDCTIEIPKEVAENTPRAAGGWKSVASKVKDLEVQLTLAYDRDDPAYAALESAHISGDPLAMAFLDDEGGVGPFGDFVTTKMSMPQNVNDLVVVSFTVKPTYVARAMVWTDGAGGGGG